MKKLVLVLVLLFTAGTVWWWIGVPPLDASRHEPGSSPPAPAPAEAGLQPAANAPAAATSREAVPAPPPGRAADEEPSPTELFGVVVDATTKAPVAGADVQLLHCMNDEFWSLDLAQGEHVATLGRATSDDAGRFRFDVERARPHRLRVVAAGYAAAILHGRFGGSTVVIALTCGAAVSGVVKCKDQLLADMDVRIAVVGESEIARGRTDNNGAFRFAGLAPADVFVQVGSPRFEENWKQVKLEAGKEHQLTIEMAAGKTLRGRVLDATTSQPVFDAEVTDSWVFRRVVRTDTEGRFELAGLRDEGFSMLHVRAPGYAKAAVNVSGKLAEELVVRLQRGGEVIGRAVDAEGRALGDAYVAVCASYWEAQGMIGSDWIAAAVGGDGRFQAVGLRPDQHYWLLVRRGGFGARVYALPRKLAAGERHDFGDVVMQRGGGIEGRVVDEAGQAIANVEVEVRGTNADSRRSLGRDANAALSVTQFEGRSVRTDARGVFRIADLAGGTFHVTAEKAGRNGEAARDVAVADGQRQEDIVLVLPSGLAIAGTLLRATELPPGDDGVADLWLHASGDRGSVSCRVAADGSFRFEGLDPGEYTITAMHTPKGSVLAPIAGVKAGATGLRLVLEASAIVAGRVVDADGKPKKARVWTIVEGGSLVHPTDDQGCFQLDVPASFRGGIGAMGMENEGVRAEAKDVVAGRTDLVLTLR